jgi:hypothetical protein
VRAGATLVTGEGDKAQLRWSDGTRCLVMPNSRLYLNRAVFNSLDHSEETQLSLETGQIFVRIARPLESASHFSVTTPTTLTSVRGTIFSVAAMNGIARIAVAKGEVHVRFQSPIGFREAIVDSGQEAVSHLPGQGTVVDASLADFAREPGIALPELELFEVPSFSNIDKVWISGQTEADGHIAINGVPADTTNDGHFSRRVQLNPGANAFTISCTDRHGLQNVITKVVAYAPGMPEQPPGSSPPVIYDASR